MQKRQKYSNGDYILTKDSKLMVILDIFRKNNALVYFCRETLNWSGDTANHIVREQEISAVCRDNEWSDFAYLLKAV